MRGTYGDDSGEIRVFRYHGHNKAVNKGIRKNFVMLVNVYLRMA